ncbi:MAG: hypothetical protein R2804_00750 [Cyclobacteriaceae bacterium]
MRSILFFGLLLVGVGGCYFDVESTLYPEASCVPVSSPTYSVDVVPLLNTYCNSCHSGDFASAGVRLDGYNYVKTYVDNKKLMGSINWSSGFSPMPKDASKLNACTTDKINQWILSGALNN